MADDAIDRALIGAIESSHPIVEHCIKAIQLVEETKRDEIRASLLRDLADTKLFYQEVGETLAAENDRWQKKYMLTMDLLNILIAAEAYEDAVQAFRAFLDESPRTIIAVCDLLARRLESKVPPTANNTPPKEDDG